MLVLVGGVGGEILEAEENRVLGGGVSEGGCSGRGKAHCKQGEEEHHTEEARGT
jgi:hypothetical protein